MATIDSGEPLRWDLEVDVAVLGVGAAGCAAAIEAHDAGARVVVLEKMPAGKEGGNTRVSGSVWFENLDVERSKTYLRNLCGPYPVPEPIVDVWATETAANTAWIEGIGGVVSAMEAATEYPELEGSDVYGGFRHVGPSWGNSHLFEFLTAKVAERGIEVRLETPARSLVTDVRSGAVVGVVAEHDGAELRIGARRGVVIATGGFENNPEMVRDYLGLPDSVPWGSPASTGDGIRMAQAVGADLWHMSNMFAHAGLRAPGYDAGFWTPFLAAALAGNPGYIYVGPDGSRFVDETTQGRHGHALINGRYELYPSKTMFVVFDETTRTAGPIALGLTMPPLENAPIALDGAPFGWNNLVERYEWSDDNQVEIDKGWIAKGDTLAELAHQLGIDPDGLDAAVAEYNQSCAAGVDHRFRRPPEVMAPLATAPFYGFAWGPMLAWTNGGPRRNEHAEVLDTTGAPIPGLYAAGQVSSTYSWCKDGGTSIADALAFGRVAGRRAARRT